MKALQKILLLLVIIGITQHAYSQQGTPLYSQYTMNKFLINPAVAGYQGITDINLTAKEQWMGFENSPSTYSLSGQTRILRSNYLAKSLMIKRRISRRRPSGRVGLGGNIYSDRNGAISRNGLQFTYAYHIHVRNSQFSFGLTGAFYQFKVNKDKFDYIYQENDRLIDQKGVLYIPDADFGFLYSVYDFYAGVSAKNLMESVLKFGQSEYDDLTTERNYYFMSGYKYALNRQFDLEGGLLLRASENLRINSDITLKAYYLQDYWAGISYRTKESVILLAGVAVKNLYFGYGFDYNLTDIQQVSYGSHEIMLGITFGDTQRRYRWLNRF